jgi:hypothetical protein
VLRRVGQYLIAAVLALVTSSALPQVFSEFRDSAPGSLLFGALQLVIASSGAAGAVGSLLRARWAAHAIAVCGTAAVGLLLVQPLYEKMGAAELRGLLLGTAVVAVAAAGMTWFARRLARPSATANAGPSAPDPTLAAGAGAQQIREAAPASVTSRAEAERAQHGKARATNERALGQGGGRASQ